MTESAASGQTGQLEFEQEITWKSNFKTGGWNGSFAKMKEQSWCLRCVVLLCGYQAETRTSYKADVEREGSDAQQLHLLKNSDIHTK